MEDVQAETFADGGHCGTQIKNAPKSRRTAAGRGIVSGIERTCHSVVSWREHARLLEKQGRRREAGKLRQQWMMVTIFV